MTGAITANQDVALRNLWNKHAKSIVRIADLLCSLGAVGPQPTSASTSTTGVAFRRGSGLESVICSTCRKASWLVSRFGTSGICDGNVLNQTW